MKKIIISIIALAVAIAAAGQTGDEFNEKYQRLVSRLGYDGVGIETHLDKWEAAFPKDGRLLEARCNYYLTKSMATQVVRRDQQKFLGNKPLFTLPDSLGNQVNYFEETFFDDELFGQALSWLDKAIEYYPLDLAYRADKINCLLAYEKEWPEMAVAEIEKLVTREKQSHPAWEVNGKPLEEGGFSDLMLGYCAKLYKIGSPEAYNSFFALSSRLQKLYPKDSNYLDNIGSYWLVAQGNDKKAMRYYKKALKINPDDAVAKANIRVIERRKAKGSRP